jgi:glucan phosphoethanolaminetransferase (alkaline phosphatase superfamily)
MRLELSRVGGSRFASALAASAALASLAAALVAAQFAILDAVLRGAASWLAAPRALFDVATSVALLLALVILARSRTLRAMLALVASAVLVLQLLVFRYYHTPLDVQVLAAALHAKHDVRPVLLRALPAYALSVAALAAVEYALVSLVQRALARRAPAPAGPAANGARDRSLAVVLAAASFGGLAGLGPRHATPEVRAVHALSALGARREPPVASAVTMPPLHADRAELPSILFVLTESVRASDYRGAGDLPTAPETAAVTRGRTELTQLRAVSSYTALSLSAILTGRSQEGPRDEILRSPSLFDFAHAARDARGARPVVAYFASQSATVFESDQVRAAVDQLATIETMRGRDVEDDADYADLPLDRDVVDLFAKRLPDLPVPSVVMLHLIGTHAPYFVDPARAPFQPLDHVVTWSGMPKLLNAYRDSIYEQDRTLARAVSAFITHAGTRPWLVVFTSDHGEAFGEHGAIHHGQNLMDEQVHVPAWIAAGEGTLSPAQSRALADHGGRFLTHLDLLPTMLDALGLWDNFSVAQHRAAMPGRSLLRPYEARAPIPVTNCTRMFQCPLNTWGLYAEDRKLVSRVWDGGWHCMALGGAEERVVDAPDPACDRLRARSQQTFPLLPNGAPNR